MKKTLVLFNLNDQKISDETNIKINERESELRVHLTFQTVNCAMAIKITMLTISRMKVAGN